MKLKRIAYTLSFSAGTMLLGGPVAFAQAPGSPQQPSMPSQQQPSPQAPARVIPDGTGRLSGNCANGQDFAEKAFVSKALKGGRLKCSSGNLPNRNLRATT